MKRLTIANKATILRALQEDAEKCFKYALEKERYDDAIHWNDKVSDLAQAIEILTNDDYARQVINVLDVDLGD